MTELDTMRKLLITGILLGATTLYVAARAAAPGAAPDPAATGTPAPAPPPGGPGGPGAGGMAEPFFATKLEWFLGMPGRVVVRDVWDVGDVEGRPWDARAREANGHVRVHAVVAYADDKPAEKVKGLMLVLSDPQEDRTFLFDSEQIPQLLGALSSVKASSDKLRDPAQGARRRAVSVMNGLEISMDAGRTGGYLGPFGYDELTVRLNPDNFVQLRELLSKAQETLRNAK